MARSLTWRCCPWCLTEDEKSAARIDQEINKILLEQKKRDRGELKLLLLGELEATQGGAAWEPTFRMSLRLGSSSQGVSCEPVSLAQPPPRHLQGWRWLSWVARFQPPGWPSPPYRLPSHEKGMSCLMLGPPA